MYAARFISSDLFPHPQVVRAAGCRWTVPTIVFVVFTAGWSASHVVAEEPAKFVTASIKLAQASTASPDDITRWIDQLGHDAYTVRQTAASRLLDAGMPAREPLLSLAEGPDPEKRAAARRLVALIDQSEFHRRIEAFATDTEGRLGLTLPGWDQYQKLVGSDPAARALFVEMQRQEGALISAMFGASKRAPGSLLESRVGRLVQQWQNSVSNRVSGGGPSLGSSAAMLFLGSVPEVELSDTAGQLIEALLQRPIVDVIKTDNRQDAVRRLVLAWLMHCPIKSEDVLRHRLNVISTAGLDEALPLPLAVVSGEAPYKHIQSQTRAFAALVVGQFGKAEYVDRIEPLLADTSMCFLMQQQPPGQNISVQVRDVALVVLLQLTGQRPADYGYLHARMQEPLKTFQLQSLFRDNDLQRSEAIAKWREWRAAQRNTPTEPKAK